MCFLDMSCNYLGYEGTNYLKGDPGKELCKRFALYSRDLVFQGRWLSQITMTSESTSTPRAPSMNLLHIRQLGERRLIPQRHVNNPMVNEGAQGVLNCLFLTAPLSRQRDEDSGVFAGESTCLPQPVGRVPERLPLSGEVSVCSGDAEEETVVGGEDVWGDDWVIWFGSSVHFLQHALWEGFRDPGSAALEVG